MGIRVILDKAKIARLYKSGMNMRQIGEALGVSNSDICKFMIKHNIYTRSVSPQKVMLDKDQITSMYESGMSQSKIGKAFSVSTTLISKFMKQHDIQVRKGKGSRKK